MNSRTIVALLVAAIALSVIALTQLTPRLQTIIAIPGVAGLFAALWEVIKSRIEHQYRLDESSAQNSFVLSSTSHMAECAFDKHVEFCEEYVSQANDGLTILFREGPTVQALDIAGKLYSIRRRYILWETTDVTENLDRFERALRKVGADEHLLETVPVGEKRTQLVDSLYATFSNLIELESLPERKTPEIAVSFIIDSLRDHLGIKELTLMRKFYLLDASKRIKKLRS